MTAVSLESVAARRAPLSRARMTHSWGPGLHAIVGAPADGGPLLLELIAGREGVRTGRLRVLGSDPRDAALRSRIALVPIEPALPEMLRVNEALDLAAAIRGEPRRDPFERLAALGVEPLARRAIRSLSREEARAVALTEALTSTRVQVLLIDEPLVGVDPRAASQLREVLRGRGQQGWTVLVATASVRDASDLTDDQIFMAQGAMVGPSLGGAPLPPSPAGARMRIVSDDAPRLLAAIARQAGVDAVARRDGLVTARGSDARALAIAVTQAILEAGVGVSEMRVEPSALEEARATATSVAVAGGGPHPALDARGGEVRS